MSALDKFDTMMENQIVKNFRILPGDLDRIKLNKIYAHLAMGYIIEIQDLHNERE